MRFEGLLKVGFLIDGNLDSITFFYAGFDYRSPWFETHSHRNNTCIDLLVDRLMNMVDSKAWLE